MLHFQETRERERLVPSSDFLGCVRYGTGTPGTGMDVVSNLPKYPVPVLMSYRTYRSVWYRYMDVVPNLPKCPVPVLMPYRPYRSVRYRYGCRTGTGTGIDFYAGTGGFGGLCTEYTRFSQWYRLAFQHTFSF